jgi:hypothetical protein
MICALPIQEREAAGMATETKWPAPWRVLTSGRTYGDNRRQGGPSSFTNYIMAFPHQYWVISDISGSGRVHHHRRLPIKLSLAYFGRGGQKSEAA